VRLPVPGADDPGVRVLRSLDQLRELQTRLAGGGRVVVIGSGFIGCEIAASLRCLERDVALVSDEPAPNVGRLGPEAAERIAQWLAEDGVDLQLGHEVERVGRAGGLLTVTAGRATVEAEVVVMAAGVAPRAELAQAAGITLTDGAIPVDAAMRTPVQGVLAAGDVCMAVNASVGRALRVEHWGEALNHGEVAGRTAAGAPAAWDAVPGFWSVIGGRTLKYAAWGDGFDDSHCQPHADGGFTVSYGRAGELVGVLTYQADDDYKRGRAAVGRRAPWP
jgi:NADPH-dependent 2,4-dienoyl-CoA reductase/sulfur reductase-like enzyme